MSQSPSAPIRRLLVSLLVLCALGLGMTGLASAQFQRLPVDSPSIDLSVPSDPCDDVWAYLKRDDIVPAGQVSVNGMLEAYSPVGMTNITPVSQNSFTGAYGFSGAMGSREVEVSFRRALVNFKVPYSYTAIVDVCGDSGCKQRHTLVATPTECIATERGATVILRDEVKDLTAVIYYQNMIPLVGG